MILYQNENKSYRLKLIDDIDIEDLRLWKNFNKKYFFLKNNITKEQQIEWFENYEKDKENFMFVVQEKYDIEYINIGCMGFRIIDNSIDVYNIMRGTKIKNSQYTMAEAFNMMNNYIFNTYKYTITCKVLKENPARSWYEKLNFENIEEKKDHILYMLNTNKMIKINTKKEKK